MTRTLKMIFDITGDKTLTWNLVDPKTGLTQVEVNAAMNFAIDNDMISLNGAAALDIKDAYIYETNKVALA